jgi:hypothetical protein
VDWVDVIRDLLSRIPGVNRVVRPTGPKAVPDPEPLPGEATTHGPDESPYGRDDWPGPPAG